MTASVPSSVPEALSQVVGHREPVQAAPSQRVRRPGFLAGMTGNLPMPDVPLRMFSRHPSLIAGSGETVLVDTRKGPVIAEGELALCVGRELRDASLDEARDAVAGYTLANDLTYLDRIEGSFTQHAKGLPTPVGSRMTLLDPRQATVTVSVNGEARAQGSMADLELLGADLLAWISARMPLFAGDIVLCGSAHTAALVAPGDIVEVACPGLDTLTTRVAERSASDRAETEAV